ncbi:symporter, partial [Bacillus subtilis]
IGLLSCLALTFIVYITQSALGIFEGFGGLAANLSAVVILNPVFVKNAGSNPVI